jgi:RNA polymerase sigma factor (sigma-70 family)
MKPTSECPADAALLSRSAAGDDAAFAEIVRRHLPLVLAVARRRLGNSGHAEDAAQQVFIALSRKLSRNREIPCLPGWLQRAAVYEAANIARRESRHRRRLDQAATLWSGRENLPADPRLDRALAALPARDREILLLHHYEKLPFARVAERLGMSEAAAQRRGHRALGKLARTLRPGISEHACAAWLAGSLAPPGTAVPAKLAERLSALKIAAQPLPWLAISAAAVVLSGGVWTTVSALRPSPPLLAATPAAPLPERPKPHRREPKLPDDKLGDATRTFISMAKADPGAAWAWVKQRPEGAVEFLRGDAMRALADRDLPAADRFLAAVDGSEPRGEILTGIFASRTGDNFEAAILWLDSVARERDPVTSIANSCSYFNSERRDLDYAGALGLVRSEKLREWLIHEACAKATALDENDIGKLAAKLTGNERLIALGYAASVMLQRGDLRGLERVAEMNGNLDNLPSLDRIALRDPEALLDVVMRTQAEHSISAFGIWRYWAQSDAPAAIAWAKSLSEQQRERLQIDRSSDGTVERLLNQP